jgi:hypothetical protein
MRIRTRRLFLTRSRALSGPTAGKSTKCQILTTTLPYLAVIGRSRPVRDPTLCRPLLFAAIPTAQLIVSGPSLGHEIWESTLTPEAAAPLRRRPVFSGIQRLGPQPSDHSSPASFCLELLGEEYQARNRGTHGTDRGGDHYERPVRSILWLRVNQHVSQTYFIFDSCTLLNSSSAPTPLAELRAWMTITLDESSRLESD